MEFDKVFNTPFDERDVLNGKPCKIARTIKVRNTDGTTAEAYRITFEDGTEIGAWPEEITDRKA
jgi:hypothetical protein